MVFHSSLTQEDVQNLERIQKTSLKVIFGNEYESYESALQKSGLETLHARRETRCLEFAKRCIKHPVHSRLFPLNEFPLSDAPSNAVRNPEKFSVNFAKTSIYKKSAIPYCQRLLNSETTKKST